MKDKSHQTNQNFDASIYAYFKDYALMELEEKERFQYDDEKDIEEVAQTMELEDKN